MGLKGIICRNLLGLVIIEEKSILKVKSQEHIPSGGSFQGDGQIGLLLKQLRSH
jgi:hypothetical protein